MLANNILMVRDVSMMGKLIYEFELAVQSSEGISIRQLIESRVRKEVDAHMQGKQQSGHDICDIAKVQLLLKKRGIQMEINVDDQIAVALKGFSDNKFFIIVDDNQVSDLDEMVQLGESTQVSFMRLVTLVGG